MTDSDALPLRSLPRLIFTFLFIVVLPAVAVAQDVPAPPPHAWSTTAGFGLALTSGNSDTSTFNVNYSVAFDPGRRNKVQSDGLFIRGKTEGRVSTNRLALTIRDEYHLDRWFLFGQNQYLRDTFKEIDYLVAPALGVGYTIADSEQASMSVRAGAGMAWEKNANLRARSSGTVTLDEQLHFGLTATTTVTHAFSGLWSVDDFGDALYQAGAGIAVAISTRTQIKLEWLDTFKNRPPAPGVGRNDQSVLVALIYKN